MLRIMRGLLTILLKDRWFLDAGLVFISAIGYFIALS